MNREQWLLEAVEMVDSYFTVRKYDIPDNVRVACGFPSKGGLNPKRKRLGECWQSVATADGSRQIFITPLLDDASEVLGVLIHELLHACLPDDVKHGPDFKEGMKALGLEGKATATTVSFELQKKIDEWVEKLGEYPNTGIIPVLKDKKTRPKSSFKLFCPEKRNCTKACMIADTEKEEDYIIKAHKKYLAKGFPKCPCDHEMEMEPEDFAEYQNSLDNSE